LAGMPPVPEEPKPQEPKLAGMPPVPEEPKPQEPKLAGMPPVPEEPGLQKSKPETSETPKPEKLKLADPLGMFGDNNFTEKNPSPPPAGRSFKIQSNAAGSNEAGSKSESDTDKNKEVDTVSELLSFGSDRDSGEKKDLPGSNLNVSGDLLDKKKSEPGELPPLPDLEDDKGTDIL
ncbi:MAG: hypothetical protein ACLFP1_00655, partial [Candidatus Goldiibacteriota bacterium]